MRGVGAEGFPIKTGVVLEFRRAGMDGRDRQSNRAVGQQNLDGLPTRVPIDYVHLFNK